tara:strand:+ start:373 stop:1446 length:1074 start_codon:yes stop_codon:yes gene_type:complete
MQIILMALSLVLISCGGGNTTGKPNQFKNAEALEQAGWVSAKLKIKSISGNLTYSKVFDLSSSALEDSQRWREESIPSEIQQFDNTKQLSFYGSDLDERLKIANTLNEQSIASAELIIDSEAKVDFSGKWGWLASDGAKTQKEQLPLMSGSGRMIIQINNAAIIHDFLTQKKLPVLWLERTSLAVPKEELAIIKTQPLTHLSSSEYEDDIFSFKSTFVKLEAYRRGYRIEEYDRAIQFDHTEERPGGRHDIGRFVTTRHTCHIKMRRLVVAAETKVNLSEVVEFDGQNQEVSSWMVANDQTQMRFKQGKKLEPVSVGFHNFGNCYHGSRFVEAIPGKTTVNSAARVIVKASYYQRLP